MLGPLTTVFDKALKTLKSAGATIVDANFTALDEFLVSNVPLSTQPERQTQH